MFKTKKMQSSLIFNTILMKMKIFLYLKLTYMYSVFLQKHFLCNKQYTYTKTGNGSKLREDKIARGY